MVTSAVQPAPNGDLPIIGLRNVVGDVAVPLTHWSLGGALADTVEDDADRPSSWAHDTLLGYRTRPDPGTASALWFLVTTVGGARAGDLIIIGNHNLGTVGATVEVQISNDPAFGTFTTIWTATPSSDARLVVLLFLHWTDVDYIRLRITAAANFTPEVGEFYFGSRLQLEHYPNLPWDDAAVGWDGSTMVTKGGQTLRWTQAAGFQLAQLQLSVSSDAETLALRSWWRGCQRGSLPSWWLWFPTSNPAQAALMSPTNPALFTLPLLGPVERGLQLPLREEPPFFEEE